MSLPRYQNYVDGRPLANSSGETFPVINPATGEAFAEVEVADVSIQQAAMSRHQRRSLRSFNAV